VKFRFLNFEFPALGVSLRVAYGTAEQNVRYCLKEDEYGYMFGIPTKSKEGQGRRTDWETVHELAKSGSAKTDFLEAVPHLGYPHIGKIESWVAAHQS